jgi:CRP-like cAMP-binding protein
VIKPVIMFNEVAALDCGPNPTTALACKDSIIWRTDCKTFHYGMERFPRIALGLLPVLAARTRWLISQYENLSFFSVRVRTAKLLLEISKHGQEPIVRQEYSINVMAARVATVPEAISRSLGYFRDRGMITTTRYKIIVCNLEELTMEAQMEPAIN